MFTSVAFSPDGKSIATGSAGSVADPRKRGVVTIWDAATLKKRHETEATERYPKFLAYSSDGKLLVAPVNGGGLIYVWDTATGKHPVDLIARWSVAGHCGRRRRHPTVEFRDHPSGL